MLIKEKIKSIANDSSSYQALAEYFLWTTDDLDSETSRSIGRKLQISANTVSEFCNDLGFASFNIFRANYLKENAFFELHFQDFDPEQPFDENEPQYETAHQLSKIYQDAILAEKQILPRRDLFLAVQAVNQASRIYLVNLTNVSGPIIDFQQNMLTIGKDIIVENRLSHLDFYANLADKNDCFLIISQEDQPEYYRFIEKLKKLGIGTIALTNYGESDLQELAHASLPLVRTENGCDSFSSILLKQSMSFVFDTIFANVIKIHYSYYQELRDLFNKCKASNRLEE